MAGGFSFTLIEKLELTQRILALEAENTGLLREVNRLTLQNELLREDMKAFAERQAAPRILRTDGRGVVTP